MTKAIGWAVKDNGQINIKTVSDTMRAAVINWLVVERSIQVSVLHTDTQIVSMWQLNKGTAELINIEIIEAP